MSAARFFGRPVRMRASCTGWPLDSTYPGRARRRWPFSWNFEPTSSTPVIAATAQILVEAVELFHEQFPHGMILPMSEI